MKRSFLCFFLSFCFLLSSGAFASYTSISFTGTADESFTLTVPSMVSPGGDGLVEVTGTWASNRVVSVTCDDTVSLVNDIDGGVKVLAVYFDGLAVSGSNTTLVSESTTIGVAPITNALFGTWSGVITYNVEIVDVGSSGGTVAPDQPTQVPAGIENTWLKYYPTYDGIPVYYYDGWMYDVDLGWDDVTFYGDSEGYINLVTTDWDWGEVYGYGRTTIHFSQAGQEYYCDVLVVPTLALTYHLWDAIGFDNYYKNGVLTVPDLVHVPDTYTGSDYDFKECGAGLYAITGIHRYAHPEGGGLTYTGSPTYNYETDLKRLVLPKSFTYLAQEDIDPCLALESIEFVENNKVYCSEDGLVYWMIGWGQEPLIPPNWHE